MDFCPRCGSKLNGNVCSNNNCGFFKKYGLEPECKVCTPQSCDVFAKCKGLRTVEVGTIKVKENLERLKP